MNCDILGISAQNGNDFFSQKDRLRLISEAGFKAVMLAWGGNDDRAESISLAEEYGLKIENAHSNMRECNLLWEEGAAGDKKAAELIKTVEDCGKYGVKTMVMHLSNGFDVPPLSLTGIGRIERIFSTAKDAGVTVALENARMCEHLKYILDNYTKSHVKYCFDAGHANIWCKAVPWLDLYGDRLAAVHLHDNGGVEDDHLIPLTGTVDWKKVLRAISRTPYCGALTVETEVKGIRDGDELLGYLKKAHSSAEKLAEEYGKLTCKV